MSAVAVPEIYTLLQQGRLQEAEQLARIGLATAPQDEAMLTLLGVSLQMQKRADEAADVHRRLTELRPQSKEHWSNLGTALREAGRLEEALATYRQALALAPGDAVVSLNLGLLHMERAEYPLARRHLLEACHADPGLNEARLYGAMMCYECGDNPTAERLVEDWRMWPDLSDAQRVDLAWLLTQLGQTADGEALFESVLETTQELPRVLANLILLRERVNRLDEARALLARLPESDESIDLVARSEVVAARAAMAMRERDLPTARRLYEQLIAVPQPERQRSNLYFGLAHVCDKQGDADAAMQALAKAHASQMETAAQLVPELLAPDVQPLKTSTLWVSAEQRAGWRPVAAPSTAESPVFVVGFPRSGTTMLEQMLDAHPALQAMDERAFLQGVVERLREWYGLVYPDQLGELDDAQCARLREAYMQLVGGVVQLKPGQRLVDKNPLNMLRLPLINRLYPNAKIILALRHPCDVLVSCYMQSFRAPSFAVLCSSLERLARGYVNAMQFWLHHAALLEPDIMELRYEAMLDDFDGHVDRLGRFLELEDASPLRNFHQHARDKGFISTPSYSQVVEPVNKRAVGRWRRYQRYLEPVLPILAPVMEHWGYEP